MAKQTKWRLADTTNNVYKNKLKTHQSTSNHNKGLHRKLMNKNNHEIKVHQTPT